MKMQSMATGQTKRTKKRKTGNSRVLTVPQLVNSSFTSFVGTNHPKNTQVRKPPTGKNICPVTKSNTSNSGFPAI